MRFGLLATLELVEVIEGIAGLGLVIGGIAALAGDGVWMNRVTV